MANKTTVEEYKAALVKNKRNHFGKGANESDAVFYNLLVDSLADFYAGKVDDKAVSTAAEGWRHLCQLVKDSFGLPINEESIRELAHCSEGAFVEKLQLHMKMHADRQGKPTSANSAAQHTWKLLDSLLAVVDLSDKTKDGWDADVAGAFMTRIALMMREHLNVGTKSAKQGSKMGGVKGCHVWADLTEMRVAARQIKGEISAKVQQMFLAAEADIQKTPEALMAFLVCNDQFAPRLTVINGHDECDKGMVFVTNDSPSSKCHLRLKIQGPELSFTIQNDKVAKRADTYPLPDEYAELALRAYTKKVLVEKKPLLGASANDHNVALDGLLQQLTGSKEDSRSITESLRRVFASAPVQGRSEQESANRMRHALKTHLEVYTTENLGVLGNAFRTEGSTAASGSNVEPLTAASAMGADDGVVDLADEVSSPPRKRVRLDMLGRHIAIDADFS